MSILTAVNPAEARGFVELLLAIIGITAWPALAVVGLGIWLAYQRHGEVKGEGKESVNDFRMWAFLTVASGAFGWWLAGITS